MLTRGEKIAFTVIAFVVNFLFILTAAYSTYYTKTKDETPQEQAGHSFSIAMLTISCATMVAIIVFVAISAKNHAFDVRFNQKAAKGLITSSEYV